MSIKAVKRKENYQDSETFQGGTWVRGMELRAWSSVVEHLPCMVKALSLMLSTVRKSKM